MTVYVPVTEEVIKFQTNKQTEKKPNQKKL